MPRGTKKAPSAAKTTKKTTPPAKAPRACKTAPSAPARPRRGTKAAPSGVAKTVAAAHGVTEVPGGAEAQKAAKRIRKARGGEVTPPSDIGLARDRLRALVKEYDDLKLQEKRTKMRTVDRKLQDGTVVPCRLDEVTKSTLRETAAAFGRAAEGYKLEIKRTLRAFPIYQRFLSLIPAFGEFNVAARLIGAIDIRRAVKMSALRCVCGLGVRVDGEGKGHAQRPVAGVKLDYHADIKKALFIAFDALRRNSSTKTYTKGKLAGRKIEPPAAIRNSPYLKRAAEYKHRLLTSPRYDAEKNTFDGKAGGKGRVDAMAWRPAAQLFLEHLYIAWRALEGLEVWPTYEAVKHGYEHGGRVADASPRIVPFEEALRIAGLDGAGDAPELDHDDAGEAALPEPWPARPPHHPASSIPLTREGAPARCSSFGCSCPTPRAAPGASPTSTQRTAARPSHGSSATRRVGGWWTPTRSVRPRRPSAAAPSAGAGSCLPALPSPRAATRFPGLRRQEVSNGQKATRHRAR